MSSTRGPSWAFTYAECASRLPRTGGFFVFNREVYGEPVAFVGGWAALLVTYPTSVAAISLILARYLREAVGPVAPEWTIASTAVLAAAFLNVIGIRAGPRTQRILTTAKVLALALLCGLLFFAFWFFRLAFLANFLSRAVLAGFVTGLGIEVLTNQARKILGAVHGGASGLAAIAFSNSAIACW